MFILKFIAIVIIHVNTIFAQQKIQSECPSVFEFVNRTGNQWYGILNIRVQSEVVGMQIEIVFSESVDAFVNNFGLSDATDNRVFTINDYERVFIPGDKVEALFFVRFANPNKIPRIQTIHFNGNRECPDNTSGDRNCLRFDTTATTAGRWDGILTVYPKFTQTGFKLIIELDGEAYIIGNDFGSVRTWNSKRFIIIGEKPVTQNVRIKIKFFVKYSPLEQIPDIKSITIDDQVYCVTDATIDTIPMISPTRTTRKPSPTIPTIPTIPPITTNDIDIYLSELPISQYPAIQQIPTEVNNQDFKCGSFMSISDRIGGGRMSDKGEFPFHAAIYINSLYKCGGSLISDKIVLTAAHCLVNVITVLRKEVFTVILGLTDLRNLTGHEAIRKVAEVIRHPDYSLSQNIPQNDIGLLVLNGQIQYTSYITHICLFSAQAPIESLIGERGTILGWGLTMDKKISQHLNHAQMTFASRLACTDSNVLFALLNNNAYCANSQGTLQTACSGDSGGGMVLLVNGKFHIRGLVSTAINEKGKICHVGQYVAFTDVSAYLKWIWDNTEIVPDLDERISERKSQTNEP